MNIPYVYTSGMNNAAEFVASGWPFAQRITAGMTVSFPWVTNEIYVINDSGATAYIGFTTTGVAGTNSIPVFNNTMATFNLKVAKLYTSGSGTFTVAASLTNVTPQQYPTLISDAQVVHNLDDESLSKKYPGI